MFHISDCKKYNRCPILYLKDQENEKSEFQQFVRLDEQITQLAVQKLKLTDYFLGERNDPKERALEALNSYEWLVKARFEYKTLRVKVPFLHRIQNAYDLYFLFVGLTIVLVLKPLLISLLILFLCLPNTFAISVCVLLSSSILLIIFLSSSENC